MRLKAEIFPYDNVNIEKCLTQLAKPKQGSGQPFINRYQTNGQRYIQIINWDKHQKPHHTEADSKIPPPIKKESNKERNLMEKGMEKGKERVHKASVELSNGGVTVKRRAAPFNPPSLSEVSEYAKSIDFQLDAEQFIDFYASKGWMVGKNKMKDWQAAVRTWKRRQLTTGETMEQQMARLHEKGEI